MPNATDVLKSTVQSILALGDIGSGKTCQFLTLPGRKFMYCFGPNGLPTLAGFDVDYEEFLSSALSMDVRSLSKGKGDKTLSQQPARTFLDFTADFNEKRKSGFFDMFDWIGIDEFTMLSDLVMDRTLEINGRAGEWPQMDDYAPQMNTLKRTLRTFRSLGKNLYVTAHWDSRIDPTTKRALPDEMMATGRLRKTLPAMFSQIVSFEVSSGLSRETGKESTTYRVQTKPTRTRPAIRNTLRKCEQYEDVTIPESAFDKHDLTGFGLASVLAKGGVL